MPAKLKKFVNPRFLKTIDLQLMRRLLARHESSLPDFPLDLLDRDEAAARDALAELLAGCGDETRDGLTADLHRIADLGTGRGLEIITAQAAREGVELFPESKTADSDGPNRAHDPKHIALRVFLDHPALFEIAADHMAIVTVDRLHEYAGRERGVPVDMTDARLIPFSENVGSLFRNAFLGDFCRVRDHVDGDEINLVITHGSYVSTVPVVDGADERVISIRHVNHAVLRYSEATGVLRMARVLPMHREVMAELFATFILERPGFFAAEDAEELYTLAPVERVGLGFVFDHAHDPEIEEVRIVEAAVDLTINIPGRPRKVVHTLRAYDPRGGALQRLSRAPVDFRGGWQLGEIVFRVRFRADEGKRRPQVTVTLRPPGVLRFRRTRHEEQVMRLVERNGLLHERDDLLLLDEAG